MNVQTERLENQTARFTVEIDPVRLDKAKKVAAKKLAKRVNIPGFRKGKAPYRILVQNGLEPQILNDAIDVLSQEIYRETLEQSELEPYGPGSFEDFELEPPTFVYTVPLQPHVELNNYADIRVDFELPEVEEDDVDDAMRRLQEQEAVTEESEEPVAIGNRITADIHSEFADDPPEASESDDEVAEEDDGAVEDPDEEEDASVVPEKGAGFIHEHDAVFRLDPENEPVLPGFNGALVGAEVDSEIEFELTVPDDSEDYADIKGRKITFHVHVKKVEIVTLPEMDDEFAASVTEEEEDGPLTLAELRDKMRESIKEQMEQQAKQEYSNEVLTQMVDQADVSYPPAMVEDQIDAMLEDLDQRLRQQGMNLENYMQLTGTQRDSLREQYRENAENILRRSLVLGEVVSVNELQVTEARIQSRIDDMVAQFGAQAAQLRSMFDTPQMRSAMVNDIVQEMAFELIERIGKGEDIAAYVAEIEAEQTAYEEAQAAAEAEAEEPVIEDAEFVDVESAEDDDDSEADVEDEASGDTPVAEVEAEEASVVEADDEDADDAMADDEEHNDASADDDTDEEAQDDD